MSLSAVRWGKEAAGLATPSAFPRPAKRGEGGEQRSCETGEGHWIVNGSPSPASRTSSAQHPLPAEAGRGKRVRGSLIAKLKLRTRLLLPAARSASGFCA